MEFVKYIQQSFNNQYTEDLTREEATLDLLLGNKIQVTAVPVEEYFGTSDENSTEFEIVMEKDLAGLQINKLPKVLNWVKSNFEGF